MFSLRDKSLKLPKRKWFTVLDKMIVYELFKTLSSVLLVLVIIIVSRGFIRILDQAIAGMISNDSLLSILAYKTIITSAELFPPALFMSVLMVFGRMYRDQEMSAIASAGAGVFTLYKSITILLLPVITLGAVLSLFIAPWAESQVDLLIKQGEETADVRGISAGKFSEYKNGNLVLYVESVNDSGVLHNVFLQNSEKGSVGVINAQTAVIKELPDGRYIMFGQGEQVKGKPGALNYVIEKFDEYAVRIEEKTVAAKFNRHAHSVDRLFDNDIVFNKTELFRRFAIPIGALLLALIGVPLAQVSPRGGVYGNMFMGFLIYFSYGNLLRVSQSWIENHTVPFWLGASTVNLILVVLGGVLIIRLAGWEWVKMNIKAKVFK